MTQIAVPNSDISNVGTLDGWNWYPLSGGSSLFEALASEQTNLGDYTTRHIRHDFIGAGTDFVECTVGLTSLLEPGAGDHVIRVWQHCPIDGDIALHNGSNDSQVCIFGQEPVEDTYGTTWNEQTYTLTSGEVSNIIDYADLYFRVYQADDGGATAGTGAVAYLALEIPDPPMVDLRPDADITTTGWATAPLWSKIEETSPDGTVISATAS